MRVDPDGQWSPFKSSRLVRYGEKNASGNGSPSMFPCITQGGTTKFTVYKNDGGTKPIDFELGSNSRPEYLLQIIAVLREEVANKSPNGTLVKAMPCKFYFIPGNKERHDPPKTLHTILISRDNDGRITLGFQKKGDEPINFPFQNSPTFRWHEGNKEQQSVRNESELVTLTYCRMLEKLVNSFIADCLVKPQPKNNQGGSNNGGYRNNNNSNHSNGNSGSDNGGFQDSYDDDINF